MFNVKYKCDECDRVFETPKKYWEPYGEQCTCCPRCGSYYFRELTRREIEEMEEEDYA